MSQIIPIYIPTYISDAAYKPNRVLPRLLFYNGLVECEQYYIESGSLAVGGVTYGQTSFPYFDNYNVVSGSFPTIGSNSLLFNNENASYGAIPSGSLYSEYWEKYVSLLYNPKTRLLNCSAIIPLADYFKMDLNDVVNFRGNYYHLRAINDYSLKDGTCNLQLLGPIIRDTFFEAPIPPPPPPQASSSLSWSYDETIQDGTFTIFDNATTIATLTADGNGNTQISESHYITASLAPVNFPSTGSVTMSLNISGATTLAVSASTNTTISASFLVASGSAYSITANTSFTQLSSSVSWSYTESSQDGTFTIFDNSTTLATLTANGSGNAQISQSHYVTASLVPVGYPGAGVTMSINVNGATTLAVSASTNTTISASFLAGAGQQYGITGSITYNAPPPNYVTGSSLIYDFGYVNSYPGTGTTVYDVSGNGITGSLINSPTYSSVKGGSLSFNKASSQRIQYSGSFPQAYTVQAFFEFSGSNNLYPGIGGQKNNNGMVLAIDSTYTSLVGGTYQIYYYGASGDTDSGAKNNASSSPTVLFDNFVMYSATNDGTNTVEYYINTGSVSTQSFGFNRTLFTPTNQVAYIGYDPAGTQYINGKLVAWLVYPFVLTAGQITQNYNIFNAR